MSEIIAQAVERFETAIADMCETPLPDYMPELDDDLLTEYAIALWHISKAVNGL